jgi:hypothetical protein
MTAITFEQAGNGLLYINEVRAELRRRGFEVCSTRPWTRDADGQTTILAYAGQRGWCAPVDGFDAFYGRG